MNKTALKIVTLVACALALAACTQTAVGGFMGLVLTAVFATFLMLGTGATQAGCSDPAEPTSEDPDVKVGPCLSLPAPDVVQDVDEETDVEPPDPDDVDIQPCLGALPDDIDEPEDDIEIGPCLEPPLPDVDEPEDDVEIGPCLQPPLEDVQEPDEDDVEIGPCLSPPLEDVQGPDEDDVEIGPCLSPLPPDVEEPEPADATEEDAPPEKDVDFGPCLSLPPPDASSSDAEAEMDVPADALETPDEVAEAHAGPASETRATARSRIQDQLTAKGVIPQGLADRLAKNKAARAAAKAKADSDDTSGAA